MSNQSSAYCYGSAAIKIEAPFLVLHEGGAGRTASRSERQRDAKPLGLGVLLAGVLVCLAVIVGTYFAQGKLPWRWGRLCWSAHSRSQWGRLSPVMLAALCYVS